MKGLPERIIDFHVHLFPNKLFDAIWDYFARDYQWEVIHRLYYRECVEYLHQRHVSPIVYSNYAHRDGIAEGLNEWNHSILDEFPDLYCFAAYHPDDRNAVRIAEKALDHPRVLGFKLQLLVQNFYPHDERLNALYELVMERDKRILFHAGTGPVGNQFVGYEHFIKTMQRYPQLNATVAHMGGLEFREFFDLLAIYENLYLDTSFTFYKSMVSAFNVDPPQMEEYKSKLLYGSDFPNLILPREEEIETLLEYDLSSEFYNLLFYENGLRLIRQHSD